MGEIEDGGTLESPEEVAGGSRVEVIDVQATVGKYLQSLVNDPMLESASSSYVPMRLLAGEGTTGSSESAQGWGDLETDAAIHTTSDLEECFDSWEHAVLLGGPGCGKSATLRWLEFRQAQRSLEAGTGVTRTGSGTSQYVPLYVNLRE